MSTLAKPGSSGYSALLERRKAAKVKAAKPVDPFAQMGPGAIKSTINSFYGAPQNDKQIQTAAQAQLDPVVAALTSQINDRAKQSTSAIGANSAAVAGELGKIDWGAPYRGAEQGQAAVDAALRAGLAGDGGALAGDLGSRLGVINDPAVAAAGGRLAATGAAAGGTELARGSASLSALLANAAAAGSYGAKQPGLARLAGLQDIAGVQQSAVTDVADAKTKILQMLPQIVQSLRDSNLNLRGNRANLLATLLGQNVTRATAKAGLVGDAAQLDYSYANANADAAASQASLDERTRHDKAIENKTTQLTPATRTKALEAIDLYFYGVHPKQQYDSSTHTFVDVPGSGVPGVDYSVAIENLMTGFGLSQEQATSLANTRYANGKRGRPMTAQQKTAKKSAVVKGRESDARGAVAGGVAKPKVPAANPNSWDPAKDPVVGQGPPGSNVMKTRSGRYIDPTFAAYVNLPGH